MKPHGVFIKPVEKEKPPTIKNITFDDFKSFYRTEELYFQAVKAKWVTDSENSFLNWMSAAVRAITIKNGDSLRVFVGIVRKKTFYSYHSSRGGRGQELLLRSFAMGGKYFRRSNKISSLISENNHSK